MTDPTPDATVASAATSATSSALGADPARTASTTDGTGPQAEQSGLDPTVAGGDPDDVVEHDGLGDGAPDEEVSPTVGVFTDSGGRVHHAAPESKNTRANLASGEWVVGEVKPEPKDWTKANVIDVVAHLVAHADDPDEIERVQAAEAAARNRSTVTGWVPGS